MPRLLMAAQILGTCDLHLHPLIPSPSSPSGHGTC